MRCSPRSTGGKAKRFLPFMEGARSCAGQALAVMNLTATLAIMYGSFTFRLADEVGCHSPLSATMVGITLLIIENRGLSKRESTCGALEQSKVMDCDQEPGKLESIQVCR